MEKLAEIIEVETRDDDYECFTFLVNNLPVKINVSRTKHKELFNELMDCLRDGYKYDLNKVIDII